MRITISKDIWQYFPIVAKENLKFAKRDLILWETSASLVLFFSGPEGHRLGRNRFTDVEKLTLYAYYNITKEIIMSQKIYSEASNNKGKLYSITHSSKATFIFSFGCLEFAKNIKA